MPAKHKLRVTARASVRRTAAVAAAPLALVGAGLTFAGPADAATANQVENAVQVARDQKGEPYQYGADGPDSFDCSGLVQYAYEKAGINMPRTSEQQAQRVRRIPKSEMQPGDLMIFEDGGDVYHIGIFGKYDGNGGRWMVHSPNEGENVKSEHPWTGEWWAGTVR